MASISHAKFYLTNAQGLRTLYSRRGKPIEFDFADRGIGSRGVRQADQEDFAHRRFAVAYVTSDDCIDSVRIVMALRADG